MSSSDYLQYTARGSGYHNLLIPENELTALESSRFRKDKSLHSIIYKRDPKHLQVIEFFKDLLQDVKSISEKLVLIEMRLEEGFMYQEANTRKLPIFLISMDIFHTTSIQTVAKTNLIRKKWLEQLKRPIFIFQPYRMKSQEFHGCEKRTKRALSSIEKLLLVRAGNPSTPTELSAIKNTFQTEGGSLTPREEDNLIKNLSRLRKQIRGKTGNSSSYFQIRSAE